MIQDESQRQSKRNLLDLSYSHTHTLILAFIPEQKPHRQKLPMWRLLLIWSFFCFTLMRAACLKHRGYNRGRMLAIAHIKETACLELAPLHLQIFCGIFSETVERKKRPPMNSGSRYFLPSISKCCFVLNSWHMCPYRHENPILMNMCHSAWRHHRRGSGSKEAFRTRWL